MKFTIIYARISTNDEKQNIKQQIDYCKKWAYDNGFEVLKVFKDRKTGKTDNRPGYLRMLKYLAKKPSVSLIVQDTDRLSRNYYDAVDFERFIIERQINLISLSEYPQYQISLTFFIVNNLFIIFIFYLPSFKDFIASFTAS